MVIEVRFGIVGTGRPVSLFENADKTSVSPENFGSTLSNKTWRIADSDVPGFS
jgi:hypothetical protein